MIYLKKLISTSILIKLLLTLSPLTLTSNAQEKIDLGDPYYVSQHDDWSIKCIKAPENSPDPCQLYQQLYDENSNPVAEIHIFNLDQKSAAFMGGSLMTPLETLLTSGLVFSIDEGVRKVYEFSFCTLSGCIARIGFTEDEIKSLKKGKFAHAYLVSARNPDFEVKATLSLKGFTAAYKALNDRNETD